VFGCRAYALAAPDKRTKLGAQSRPATYLGPASEHATNHRLLLDDTHSVVITRDIIFQENVMPARTATYDGGLLSDDDDDDDLPYTAPRSDKGADRPPMHTHRETDRTTIQQEAAHEDDHPRACDTQQSNSSTSSSRGAQSRVSSSTDLPAPHVRRSTRERTPNVRLTGYALVADGDSITPGSYAEAIKLPEAQKWHQAMEEEFSSLQRNGTFTLVPLPKGRKAIGSRWLYKIKRLADGTVERYKARWVAKGYTQRFGIDYEDTFAPVVRPEDLRLVLALATALDLEIEPVDIVTAFLHSTVTEEIYVEQPQGFVDKERPQHVCRLHKSLYGLKQAPLEWHRTINEHLITNHFMPTEADPCLYVCVAGGLINFLALCIDDCTIVAHRSQLRGIKEMIAQRFLIMDLGPVSLVLGIEVQCDCELGHLYIRQCGKINNILNALQNCKPVATPMLVGTRLLKPDDQEPRPNFLYRQAIGMLSYLAHASRPDIMFAVSQLSQFTNDFGQAHVIAVKHVARYLAGTRDLAIHYD
jgi:histone deacetylase 1/2